MTTLMVIMPLIDDTKNNGKGHSDIKITMKTPMKIKHGNNNNYYDGDNDNIIEKDRNCNNSNK